MIGCICMDQMLIDVSALPHILPGDEVVLIGKSGSGQSTDSEFAHMAGTISYFCGKKLGAWSNKFA